MADTPTTDGAPDPHATNTGGSPLIERAYSLSDPDEARALYDEWAGTYDDDLASDSQGYVAPAVAADAVARASGVDGEILDAGCGTGLVGVALAERGRGASTGRPVTGDAREGQGDRGHRGSRPPTSPARCRCRRTPTTSWCASGR